jgi:hypothetical protein
MKVLKYANLSSVVQQIRCHFADKVVFDTIN